MPDGPQLCKPDVADIQHRGPGRNVMSLKWGRAI